MLELNGYQYSRTEFEGYKFRAKFEFGLQGENHKTNVDIYTTNPDKWEVTGIIASKATKKVTSVTLVNFSTKEQDDKAAELINETLLNL
jgi:hypothetical protein